MRSLSGLIILATTLARTLSAQQLPDSLVAQIREGAAQSIFHAGSPVVPLVGTRTLPLVEVRINGHGPFRFLIDLGSNVVVVRRSIADAAGGMVLVDRPRGDVIRFDSLTLGAVRFDRVIAAAYDTLDVDGVLGYNILQLQSFTLDYPNQTLELHTRALSSPDFRTIFPYTVEGRMPMLTLRIGADSLVVNLDTGATEWMTIPPGLRDKLRWRGPVVPGRITSNNQTGPQQVEEGRLRDTVRIGPLAYAEMLVYINPNADGSWVGSAAMQDAIWTFDPPNRRLAIQHR
jgi:predicted aspartyl protease